MSPRLTDRTLRRLLVAASALLLAAVGLAIWINTAPALSPVPVASSARG